MDETSSQANRGEEPTPPTGTQKEERHSVSYSAAPSASVPTETEEEKHLGVQEKRKLFNLLGRAYTMEIAARFAGSPGPWRFNELRDDLDISQNTLSARLGEFVEEDLITRRSYDEIPPRVEYEATEKLREFKPVVHHLTEWWQDD